MKLTNEKNNIFNIKRIMGKYRMNEPYGYQEVVGFTSLKSEMDGEMSSNKKTDEQQSAEIKAESKAREKADKELDARVKALEEASGGGSDIEEKVNELEQAVNTLNGSGEGSVKKTAEDAAKTAVNQVVDDAPETYDTLKEVATYITTSEEEKTEMKNSISSLEDAMDDKADKSQLEDVQAAVSRKADSENVYTKAEVDETVAGVEEEISAFSSDIASLNAKDEQLQGEIGSKAAQSDLEALSSNVYTKEEADGKFLTEHQDISGLATKDEVESGITALGASITLVEGQVADKADADSVYTKEEVDAAIEGFAAESAVTKVADDLSAESERAISAETELLVAVSGKADADVVYTQEEVDALLAEKEEEMQQKYKGLKDMVLDLYYATTYSVPTDCGLDTMLKSNNGEAKLTEDLTIGTIAAGQTAKNIVKLNLGGKTLTFTGSTTTNPAMMFRNKQQVNIGGSGTVDANGRIAVEANGADCEITLSGTMFGRPTYVTDRSGGELIYCYLGTINITEGIFKNNGDDKTFLLNCYDDNYKNGTAKIIVTGGKFYDFDPGNNKAEGEGTSFLAKGYHTEASTVVEEGVEHTVYTVKKD